MILVPQGKGAGEGGVKKLVEDKGLLQISDPAALMAIVDSVLAGNATQLEQYRGGKTKLQGFFVGCAPCHVCPPPTPALHGRAVIKSPSATFATHMPA